MLFQDVSEGWSKVRGGLVGDSSCIEFTLSGFIRVPFMGWALNVNSQHLQLYVQSALAPFLWHGGPLMAMPRQLDKFTVQSLTGMHSWQLVMERWSMLCWSWTTSTSSSHH